MKIIVAGDGKVGATLARQLCAEGHDLTLIDTSQKVLETSVEQYDVMAVHGNCASMEILEQAGVKDADILIVAAGADEVNLLCCMTAHGMNENIHTIGRIRNPEYLKQVYEMRDLFALSLTVNPEQQAAVEMERLLKYPGFLKRDTFAKGRVEIVELRVDAGSRLCNVTLNDMDGIVKCQVLVCAVVREGKAISPDGDFVIREEDRLFVTAPTDALAVMLKNLGIVTTETKRVIVVGGSKTAYYLVKQLEGSGIDVQIIEKDHDRCQHLAEMLPEANIIEGDGCDQDLLTSEGIENCDAFVTLTNIDELNMVMSMYADSLKVPQIITKVSRGGNQSLLDNLSLGSVICPKDLCSNNIVRYVRAVKNQTGAAVTVHSIADGQAEAIEFVADENTKNIGVPLRNMKLKKNILLACITHEGDTEIPNGDSCYREGDTIIVVKSCAGTIYQLNDIFE